MLPKTKDRFEEWLRMPLPREAGDPRFEIRRAPPWEFERIYDLVDATFGVARPRVLYDWLYRRNPGGMARCWIVSEKHSGQLISSAAHLPWPIARGGEALWGFQVGDAAAAPGFQRQGISELRGRAHTWDPDYAKEIRFAWPNEKAIGHKRKHGHGSEILGPLSDGVLPLDATARSRIRGWLRLPTPAGSGPAGTSPRTGTGHRELAVEAVTRFDSAFDEATQRCMSWRGFWSPHDADFLNWRYLDHPTRSYRALAVLEGEDVAGYCVIRPEGSKALLMEFAAPERGEVPRRLLQGALEVARESACRRLTFFAPPGWCHWPSFRDAGLVNRPSSHFLWVDHSFLPAPPCLRDWQLMPGDHDDR
jgi:hypothetical protein